MRHAPLGQSGIAASVIGLGTWAIGGWLWGGTDETQSIAAVHASLDAGVNLIDSAPVYGFGLAEELIGKAIRGHRERVVIATKCGLVWHAQQGEFFFEHEGKRVYRYLGGDSIRHEVEQSLRRLGTDYIDLYQAHWQDNVTPVEETMGTLLDLKREGKIRAIGLSNVTAATLERYRRIGRLDSDQEKYSMLDRQAEAELLPYTQKKGIALLAYSPLAMGLLSGKISPERRFPADDLRATHPRFTPEYIRRVNAALKEFEPIAAGHGATVAQLALAWTLSVPGITHVLVGARNPEQARANAQSAGLPLSAGELSRLTETVRRKLSS